MRKTKLVDKPAKTSPTTPGNRSTAHKLSNKGSISRGRDRHNSEDSVGSKASRSTLNDANRSLSERSSSKSRITRGISRASSQSSTVRSRSNSPRPNKALRGSTNSTTRISRDEEISLEVTAWLLSLKLTKTIRNPKQDFSNGCLMAEIFHKFFGSGGEGAVSATKLKRYLPALNRFHAQSTKQSKMENWETLMTAAKKFGVQNFATHKEIDGIVMGKSGVAIVVLSRLVKQISPSEARAAEEAADISRGLETITISEVNSIDEGNNIEGTPLSPDTTISTKADSVCEDSFEDSSKQSRLVLDDNRKSKDNSREQSDAKLEDKAIGTSLDDTSVRVVEVTPASEEALAALRWAEEEAAKAAAPLEEEDDQRKRVVFQHRGSGGEEDMQRRSMLGEITGSVGRGSSLRRTEKREKARNAAENVAQEELGLQEEAERTAMEAELRLLLEPSKLVDGSRVALCDDVHKGLMLGRGRFACVFSGSWTQPGKDRPTDVAVKEFMFGVSRRTAPLPVQRIFHHEARTLATLAHHPKVMDLVAVVLVPRPMILLELLAVGSLFDVMHGDTLRSTWQSASMREKLGLCVDVSEGLAHLHASGLLHGDLKSHNVLVGLRRSDQQAAGAASLQEKLNKQLAGWGDGDCSLPPREEGLVWIAKLGDLGTVARVPGEGESPLVAEVGTAGWMAPEVCWSSPTAHNTQEDKGYGLGADVWSFGVVLWECFGDHHRLDPFRPGTGLWRGDSNPFAGIAAEEYLRRLQDGERWPLTLTDDDEDIRVDAFQYNSSCFSKDNKDFDRADGTISYVRALQEVACSCWQLDPSKRTIVEVIMQRLHVLADALVR